MSSLIAAGTLGSSPVRQASPQHPERPDAIAAHERSAPLDGLRTLAVALVVLYHFHVTGFRGGFIGVNIFFVLSGYLITTLLIRERATTGTIRLPAFWMRRLLRLYPALLVMVLVGVLIAPWVGDGGATLALPVTAAIALSYTGNIVRAYGHISQGMFAPTWSLGMEEQFYLLWPPILALVAFLGVRRRRVLIGLAALIAGSSVASFLLFQAPGGSASPDIYFSPVLNIGPLMMGCLLAIVSLVGRVRDVLAGRTGLILSAAGLIGLLAIQFTLDDWWKQQVLVVAVELPLVGISSMMLIAGMSHRRSPVSAVLAWRPLAWFGRNVSYSLYLWHVLVLTMVTWFIHGALGTLIAIPAAVAVAIASHLLIERPALRLKRRFEVRAQRPPSS